MTKTTHTLRSINDYARRVVTGKDPGLPVGRGGMPAPSRRPRAAKMPGARWRFDAAEGIRVVRFIGTTPAPKGPMGRRASTARVRAVAGVGSCVHFRVDACGAGQGAAVPRAYIECRGKTENLPRRWHRTACMVADGVHGAGCIRAQRQRNKHRRCSGRRGSWRNNRRNSAKHYGIRSEYINLLRTSDYSRFGPLINKPGDGASPSCCDRGQVPEHVTGPLRHDDDGHGRARATVDAGHHDNRSGT